MSQRLRDRLILLALGLAVNGAVAALVASPGYTDAYYYFAGATLLVRGGPLVEPYLWQYLSAPASLPAPAFGYWQPLPSLLGALAMVALPGLPPFDAAQVPFVLLAASLPIIAYEVAAQIGERRHAWHAGLLMTFSGFYVIYWSLPDSFTPFAMAAAAALALAASARGCAAPWRWAAAGVAAGLAHLARADGLLLIPVLAAAAAIPGGGRSLRARLAGLAAIALGYLMAMGLWWARNLTVFGSVQPPGGFSTLWLLDYNELFIYPPASLTPARYFAAGAGPLLAAKWQALLGNLATFIGVQNLIFLTPFTLIGMTRRWRSPWLAIPAIYGLLLFAAMTLAFTLPGLRGGWLHSGGALMPFITAAAALGLDDAIAWAARRRRWPAARARRLFGAAAIALATLLTGYLVLRGVVGLPYRGVIVWNQADAIYDEIGQALNALGVPPDRPVMVNNPPGFFVHTGRGGVPLPAGGEAMLLQAADDYRIAYLVVDRNVAPGLSDLYWQGPQSPRLALLEVFRSGDPVYLYHILPPD